MRSTNRGPKGGGESEFYPTPTWAVRRLLERLPLPSGKWLEAGAGEGAIVRAVREHAGFGDEAPHITALELRPECYRPLVDAGANEIVLGSFQQHAASWAASGRRFMVTIMNPPFSQALAFVEQALVISDWVICLERTPWIGDAQERYEAFSWRMPNEYRVGRIDFNGEGGDSVPYSWFVWGPGDRRATRGWLELLSRTPSDQRIAGNLPPSRQLSLIPGGR